MLATSKAPMPSTQPGHRDKPREEFDMTYNIEPGTVFAGSPRDTSGMYKAFLKLPWLQEDCDAELREYMRGVAEGGEPDMYKDHQVWDRLDEIVGETLPDHYFGVKVAPDLDTPQEYGVYHVTLGRAPTP